MNLILFFPCFRLLVLVVRLIRTVIAMGGNELEVLEHYNRKIQKYGDRDDAAEILTKCLTKLDQVRVNISLLQVSIEQKYTMTRCEVLLEVIA